MEVLSYHSSTENRQQIIPAMLQKAKRVSGVSKITSEILTFWSVKGRTGPRILQKESKRKTRSVMLVD